MAYRVVKYIICAEFWGTNIIAVPLSTNSGGTCPPVPPVIYAHAPDSHQCSDVVCLRGRGIAETYLCKKT